VSVSGGWVGCLSGMGETSSACNVIEEEPLGNHPFERPRQRWKRYVKLDSGKTGFAKWRWMEVAGNRIHSRAVVMVLNRMVLPPWCRVEGYGNGVEPYGCAIVV